MPDSYLETDLSKIKHLASVKEKENIRFRSFLKGQSGSKVDRIVHELHNEIIAQIDCTLCGNCCCTLKPELHKDDIALLAQLENTAPKNYISSYCEKDNGEIFLKTEPCRYLRDKKCSIYESRVPMNVVISLIPIKKDLYYACGACWNFMQFVQLYSI
ncbi:MAG: YkgJ family cysteine cluster protein [Prevotellaceae bacterium]|jgi:hypothetical protein|nr:YkgJ family cysteine cluster protein [Prevotellaceae bacterium]